MTHLKNEEQDEIRPATAGAGGGGRTEIAVESGGGDETAAPAIPDALPVLPLKNTVLFPHLLSPLLVNTAAPALDRRCSAQPGAAAGVRGGEATGRGEPRSRRPVSGRHGDADREDAEVPRRFIPAAGAGRGAGGDRRLRRRAAVPGRTRAASRRIRRLRFGRDDGAGAQPGPAIHRARVRESAALRRAAGAGARRRRSLEARRPGRIAPRLRRVGQAGDPEELDVRQRVERVLAEVSREQDANKVESEIREKVCRRTSGGPSATTCCASSSKRSARSSASRKLGDRDRESSPADRGRRMPEEAHTQATRELERLAQMPTAAAEHGVSAPTRMDGGAAVAQGVGDRLDPDEARRILDEDHYGLDKVKDRIVEYIAVLSLKRDLKGRSCASSARRAPQDLARRSIARALGREFQRVSLGGVRDEAEIRGHRRTYVGALPVGSSRTCAARARATRCSCSTRSTRSEPIPRRSVLGLLEVSIRSRTPLQRPLSRGPVRPLSVLFIVPRIDGSGAAGAARPDGGDRAPGYTAEEKLEIAKRFLVPRQLEQNGVRASVSTCPTRRCGW